MGLPSPLALQFSRLLPEFDWYLIVEQENDPAEARLNGALLLNLALSLVVTALVLALAHVTLRRYQRRLEQMATLDMLTATMNRHVFEAIYDKSPQAARRGGKPASIIMLDLDHFKHINDTRGHLFGDRVLRKVAQILLARVRDADTVCRWGGEEFVILLPECACRQALELAEDLRQTVARAYAASDSQGVTASFGVAELGVEESAQALLEKADKALYQAKGQLPGKDST